MGMHIKTHYTEMQANDIYPISVNSYNNMITSNSTTKEAEDHDKEDTKEVTPTKETGRIHAAGEKKPKKPEGDALETAIEDTYPINEADQDELNKK